MFLKKYKIALWDIIDSCFIRGSSDSSIRNVVPNNLVSIVEQTNIRKIYTLGNTTHYYYQKYSYSDTFIEAVLLPSTSSANASWSLDMLVEAYQVLKNRRNL
ncbi:MAG: hypothetical protein PUB18_06500 [bacterium]|nr:hypothetical protein [bacterium]